MLLDICLVYEQRGRSILLALDLTALLVLPMGGESLLGNLVHTVRTYLHFNPSSLL